MSPVEQAQLGTSSSEQLHNDFGYSTASVKAIRYDEIYSKDIFFVTIQRHCLIKFLSDWMAADPLCHLSTLSPPSYR